MTGCCSPSIMDLPSSSVLATSGVTSSSAVQAQDTIQKDHAPETPQALQKEAQHFCRQALESSAGPGSQCGQLCMQGTLQGQLLRRAAISAERV